LSLQDHFDDIYWYFLDQEDARFRIAFDHLPRWEALGALGYVNYVRLCDSLRGFPEGEVVFGDREAAKKMAEYYDAAQQLMPDDFYLKRIFAYCALYGHLRAGGLTIAELHERVAEAERLDEIVSPYCESVLRLIRETVC
jgi:hypothetical protein